jgi:DnaJ-class molecular chaperone
MQSSEEKTRIDTRRAKSQVIKKQVMMSPLLGKGCSHSVKKYIPEICPDCNGTGWAVNKFECYTCGGEGQI